MTKDQVKSTAAREKARSRSWAHTDAAADRLLESAIEATKAAILSENVSDGLDDIKGAITLLKSARTLWS